MNLKDEMINLYYQTGMDEISEDQAIDALENMQIDSGLSPSEFILEITKIIKQMNREI